MKARQDFEVAVNKDNVPTSHYFGDPLGDKKLVKVKAGEEIPEYLNSYVLQFNPDFVDLSTVEKPKPRVQEPIIVPRKYSQESITLLINEFGEEKSKAVAELRKILLEDFNYKSRSVRLGYLTNKILELQERKRRG